MQQTAPHFSLFGRYIMGEVFTRFAIMRVAPWKTNPNCGWRVVGPKLPWTGVNCDTFEEAIQLVSDRIRQYRVAE